MVPPGSSYCKSHCCSPFSLKMGTTCGCYSSCERYNSRFSSSTVDMKPSSQIHRNLQQNCRLLQGLALSYS